MKIKYKALLVGLGNIGMGYDLNSPSNNLVLSHAKSLMLSDRFIFKGAVDSDILKRKKFEKYYNLPSYSLIKDALTNLDVDVAIVATPTNLHLSSIEELIRFGIIKSILCEKPISYSIAEAKKILKICSSRNCKLYINYMRRTDPGVIEIKNFFDENINIFPCKGLAWYSKGLLHNGSHLVDLLKIWLGDIVGYKLINKGSIVNDGRDCESDFLIKYQNGDIIFLSCDEKNFSHYTIELVTPIGRLRYEAGGFDASWQKIVPDKDYPNHKILDTFKHNFDCQMNYSQLNLINEWANSIDFPRNLLCTGEDATKTLKVLNSIRRLCID